MKKIFVTILVIAGFAMTEAQIWAPEGLSMPGAWNGWTNPPANVPALGSSQQVTGGKVTLITQGTRRYQTTIKVAASGGDITGGTHQWLFTSGPSNSPWNNKWSNAVMVKDSLQTYTFQHGTNNSATVTNGKWYTVNWKDNGYTNTQAIFMETSAAPVTIDSVTNPGATVPLNTAVTVSVKLSAALSSEEKVYLRYSTDNFSTSSVVAVGSIDPVTFWGTAQIPAQSTPGTTVKYYVMSTTIASSSWGSKDPDMLTIKYKNTGTANFSYLVEPITSVADGNWSSPSTWNINAVPASGANVTINSTVTVNTDVNVSALTINATKTLVGSDGTQRTITVANGGTFTNNGTFTHGGGIVSFAGSGTVSGTAGFSSVYLAGGVDFGTASTINGTLRVNAGGYVNTNAPSYASGSVLQYNSGGKYGRYLEWNDTTGAGYPYHVRVSNGTILDLAGDAGAEVARRLAGTLTIDTAAAVTMDTLSHPMTAALTVNGGINNYGRFTLSSSLGGDLAVGGDFTNTGMFTTNSREIAFSGASQQTINTSSNSSTTIDYLAVNNAAGVSLGTVKDGLLTVNNRLRFATGAGVLSTDTDTLVLGASGWLSGEAAGRYVSGYARKTMSVGTAADSIGNLGLSLSAGGDLGSVTLLRKTGSDGIVTVSGKSGIRGTWELSASGAQPFASRTATIQWVSSNNNSRDLTTAQVYQSTDNGTSWSATSDYQNASSTRSVTASATRAGLFTVSDASNSLGTNLYPVSIANGNWSAPATWNTGSVPADSATVLINSDVTLNANATVTKLTVNAGHTFAASDGTPRTLTIIGGGSLVNSGTFTHGNGTVVFGGAGTVTGTTGFYNVNISNGVNFDTAATIHGTLKINAGGYLQTNKVTYASGSTLQYNTGGYFGRSNEWSDTTGRGYPYHVRVSNGTTLDLANGVGNVYRRIAGNLTIDSLSTLTADTTGTPFTAGIEVKGAVVNNGRLILSSQFGADLFVGGHFTNNAYFTTNNRELVFVGSAIQEVRTSDSSTTVVHYVSVNNPSGVQLYGVRDKHFTIQSRLRFVGETGNFMTGFDTLVLGPSAHLMNETLGRYVVGVLKTTKTTGAGVTTLGDISVQLSSGSDLGDVTVTRITGSAGAVTVGGNSGISRTWRFSNTGNQTFSSRWLTLAWVASDDNGVSLTKTQIYRSSNYGSSWYADGAQQNSLTTRSDSIEITSLGWFTVSDSTKPLSPSAFTLTATALIEGFWEAPTAIRDTLTAELRSVNAPYALISSAKGYSSNTGVTSFSFSGIQNGTQYYLVLKHRNTIETWSAAGITFGANAASYNFTTAVTQAYGSNLILKGAKYCLYSGDATQDGIVDFSDLSAIDNDQFNFTGGYVATDLTGDNFVDFSDLSIADNNQFNFISVIKPGGKSISRPAPKKEIAE